MAIGLVTHKRLWSRAGDRCAYPACPMRLIVPMGSGDDDVIVGKECHIVAQSAGGPRNPDSLQADERERWKALIDDRDGYGNLILMCGVHHDVIDKDVETWTVDKLVALKAEHERRIDADRSEADRRREEAQLRYALIIDGWSERIGLDEWSGRLSRLVADGAYVERHLEELEAANMWLLERVWPRELPAIQEALQNFRAVSQDLVAVASWHTTPRSGLQLIDRAHLEAFGLGQTREQIEFLEQRSEYLQSLAGDLAIELTRAANLVADEVRDNLWATYRLDEGYATVGLGLGMDMSYKTLRPRYAADAGTRPYEGLEAFLTARADRDYHLDVGLPPEGSTLPGVRL